MGNCIRKQSTTEWGGEEWGSFGSGGRATTTVAAAEGDINTEQIKSGGLSLSSECLPTGTEVKFRISKKQLEQLVKIQGLSSDQILVHLIHAADDRFQDDHQRPWKPALHSIPE